MTIHGDKPFLSYSKLKYSNRAVTQSIASYCLPCPPHCQTSLGLVAHTFTVVLFLLKSFGLQE